MAEAITVDDTRRRIQRWQAGLRFAQTEDERKCKAACVKMYDADEQKGFITFSIGSDSEHRFKLLCNGSLVIAQETGF